MVNKLGRFIEAECSRQNLTIKELARRSEISEDLINKLKRGAIKSPSMNSLKCLANGFGMPFKLFLEEIGEIDSVYEYALNKEDSIKLMRAIIPYTEKCRLKFENMNENEILDIANYLMYTMKMISYKFID